MTGMSKPEPIKLKKFGGKISLPIALEVEEAARLRRLFKKLQRGIKKEEERMEREMLSCLE